MVLLPVNPSCLVLLNFGSTFVISESLLCFAWFPLPSPSPGSFLQVVCCGNHRAHLIYFPVFMDASASFPSVQCLKNSFQSFIPLLSGRRINPVPVTLSLPKVEGIEIFIVVKRATLMNVSCAYSHMVSSR